MSNTKKHILLICANSQSVINFRSSLITNLINRGCIVSVLAFDDIYRSEIELLGCQFFVVDDNNRSINPFKILTLKTKYAKFIKTLKPNIILTFMLKPNVFGTLAAKKCKVKNVFCMVEGAGDVFTYKSLKWKIIKKVICFLYKRAFSFAKKVFFLNNDDLNEFVNLKLVKKEQTIKISGIGVDLEKFKYHPLVNYNNFLMVSRLKKAKGVFEYCDLARKIKNKHKEANFNLLGAEGDIKVDDIQEYIDDGSINYLGFTKDVLPNLIDTTCLVLLSHREGLPMSIMEALSVGRIIITSDSIGCRESIINGEHGFIVTLEENEVFERVEWILTHKEELNKLSYKCRKFAEEVYDQKKINEIIIEEVLK